MKDRLEEFVLKNREEFDVREPDPSLWLKIHPGNEVRRMNRRMVWLKYAAAIAVIFVSFSAGVYYLSGAANKKQAMYGEMYEKIKETEAYYNTVVNEKYNELKPYMKESPELKKDLDYDLNELDQIYQELKEDLRENAGNPEVIDAMIHQYRIKVEILEDLLNQLKEKEQYYEKENERTL